MPREGLTDPHSRPSGSLCSPQLTRPSPQHRPAAALPAAQAEVPACSGAPKAPLPQRCLSSPSSPSASPPPSLPFPSPSLLIPCSGGEEAAHSLPATSSAGSPVSSAGGRTKGRWQAVKWLSVGQPCCCQPCGSRLQPCSHPSQEARPLLAPLQLPGGSLGLISCPPLCFWGWEGEGQCRDLPPAGPFLAAESDKLGLGVVL